MRQLDHGWSSARDQDPIQDLDLGPDLDQLVLDLRSEAGLSRLSRHCLL